MDGIQTMSRPRILLIAATNRKEMLDGALLRPGRFDRHIAVDLPDKKGRKHILSIHAPTSRLAGRSTGKVAEETFGFSGAQLESVMNEAAIYAMREDRETIRGASDEAIDKVMMGEKTDREATKEERERVAIHELGHAIMAEIVRPGSVSQVALSPRGQALGYVRHNPQQDRYLYTKEISRTDHGRARRRRGGRTVLRRPQHRLARRFRASDEHRAHDGRVGTDRAGHRRSPA